MKEVDIRVDMQLWSKKWVNKLTSMERHNLGVVQNQDGQVSSTWFL